MRDPRRPTPDVKPAKRENLDRPREAEILHRDDPRPESEVDNLPGRGGSFEKT